MHAVPTHAAIPERLPFYRQLYFQVVVAIVAGVLLGHFEPQYAEQFKPLGDDQRGLGTNTHERQSVV
jgi:aerobic C4-dicarboxylate transport protein